MMRKLGRRIPSRTQEIEYCSGPLKPTREGRYIASANLSQGVVSGANLEVRWSIAGNFPEARKERQPVSFLLFFDGPQILWRPLIHAAASLTPRAAAVASGDNWSWCNLL